MQVPNAAGALYNATRLLDGAGVNVEHAGHIGRTPWGLVRLQAQPMASVTFTVVLR